ncbi:putative ankyrin repeat protein RF_0381 [Leptopilina heterotoma]|uniref:putative ankyrin repeat protein RF_0381 n=1 Tax=Leptopilina heterotoma TaxID=63436 RepID=UPI001CAA10D7|nr:putative ankyrin repeat protein RF_0381 [Leptopilina heterotoma]
MELEFRSIINERKNTIYFSQQINPLEQALQFGSIVEIEDILREKYQATLSPENDWAKKCRQIINICLEKKLNVNVKLTNYCSLLHFMIKHLDEDFESVIKKCKELDINALNVVYDEPDDNKSLLHFAIDQRKQNAVKALIEFGADVDIKDSRSRTPLFYAVLSKQIETAEMLLKAGADINAKDSGNMMPINYAFGEREDTSNEKYKPSKLVKLLCSYGADLNFKNQSGSMTLVIACRKGNFKEIEFLIEHGADLLSSDEDGKTALHSAAAEYNYKLVDFLIRRGVDINAQDMHKENSIHHLANTLKTINNVLEYFGDNTHEAISDIWNFDFEGDEVKKAAKMIEFLADNGADINTFNKQNITPLMISVRSNALEITECLLELNAKIYNSNNFLHFEDSFNRHVNTQFNCDKITTWALLTAFLALKDIAIHENTFLSVDFQWVDYSLESCYEEVAYMQEKKIWADRKVTFYDFLNEDLLKVTKYFRNDDVMSVLEYEKYQEFPDYRYFFEKRKERVEKMKNCQNVFIRFLKEFFKRNLPSVVIYQIINYLTAGDLRNFGRAFCITEKSPNGKYFI